MICYRDRTFCPFGDCRKFGDCPTALTEKVKQGAAAIGLPIAQYMGKPSCYEKEDK